MNPVRCFLAEGNLNKMYWPYCVKTAVYLGNRSLANTKLTKTPYELFYGKKPDLSNLRLYGSTVYVRIPDEKRKSKLYPKAEKGKLLGYTDVGYLILIGQKVVHSRNVTKFKSD